MTGAQLPTGRERGWYRALLGLTLLLLSTARLVQAQDIRADYDRATRFLYFNADSLVLNADVDPNWIGEEDRFWYRRERERGQEFVLVDARQNARRPAFDHARLAAALSDATGASYAPYELPFDRFEFVDDEQAIEFSVDGARWRCDLSDYACAERDREEEHVAGTSPDGRWVAFVRDYNLYVRSTETGQEIQLTHDGERYRGYAAAPRSPAAMARQETMDIEQPVDVRWSPDSKKLVTYRMDQRSAKRLALVQSSPENRFWPQHYTYAYPLPGEMGLPVAEPVIFDLERRKQIWVETDPIPSYYTTGRPSLGWDEDGERLYFRRFARGYKQVQLVEVDARTGATRVVIEERADTYVDPNVSRMERLDESGDIIWASERDGWNHLYLYDGETGALKHQITKGEWVVRDVVYVDEERRRVYFTAGGREEGDPYLRYLYRIDLDGSDLERLTPERADHSVDFSPSGAYFVDTYSRVDLPPVTVLRRSEDGAVVRTLEEANVERLRATGWQPPEPFRVKAADGTTDIYGIIWRPSNFDSSKTYPVGEQIYTGPHSFHVPKTFEAYRSAAQAIAELGFVTVMVDGRGTGRRSRAFRTYSYKNLGGATEDHVAALRQLAAERPYMDLSRVGIYGHSAGGYDAAHALLTHPEIYDVAVSSGGNHDHRLDKAWWNELYMGYPIGEHYEAQSNVTLAPQLEDGKKLLLVHGELDNNVPPSATLRLVDALIEANKEFDLLIMPNMFHGLGGHPYFIRKRWDYFVEHLLGVAPPVGYEIER